MWFQKLARKYTSKPVVMSPLAVVPSIHCALGGRIAIFTANRSKLEAMHDIVKAECGFEWNESRYVLVGCADVPGFEAVCSGDEVHTEKLKLGIVRKAKQVLAENQHVSAFLFECTQLPPFSGGALGDRATGLRCHH